MMIEGIWLIYCIWILVCAAGVLVCLYGEFHERLPLTVSGKLVAASAYLAAAFSLGAPYSRYGRILLGGMIFCWLGDLLLTSRKSRRLFMAGLASFLVGHIFYTAAFVARGVHDAALIAALGPMLIFSWLVVRWLGPYLDHRTKVPVFLYVIAISVMALTAFGTLTSGTGLVLLSGAVLFVISDLAVARNRFVAPGFINRAWGLPVYFSAQFLLAASVST